MTSTLRTYDGAGSSDSVYMSDAAGGRDGFDYFGVTSSERAFAVFGPRSLLNVTVRSFGTDLDFIHGDGLVQTFDISSWSAQGIGEGVSSEVFPDPKRSFSARTVHFVVNRLKVTPKVCKL